MDDCENMIEALENRISEVQKKLAIKREFLKRELEDDNEPIVEIIQKEIVVLKENIIHYQTELRKLYLKLGNKSLVRLGEKKEQTNLQGI